MESSVFGCFHTAKSRRPLLTFVLAFVSELCLFLSLWIRRFDCHLPVTPCSAHQTVTLSHVSLTVVFNTLAVVILVFSFVNGWVSEWVSVCHSAYISSFSSIYVCGSTLVCGFVACMQHLGRSFEINGRLPSSLLTYYAIRCITFCFVLFCSIQLCLSLWGWSHRNAHQPWIFSANNNDTIMAF